MNRIKDDFGNVISLSIESEPNKIQELRKKSNSLEKIRIEEIDAWIYFGEKNNSISSDVLQIEFDSGEKWSFVKNLDNKSWSFIKVSQLSRNIDNSGSTPSYTRIEAYFS